MSRGFDPAAMAQYQRHVPHVRNICILAHVDHGKTTLADCLLASNGIISARMAGKVRYMDSREDEQQRGITMKSSAVTLLHRVNDKPYIVNLIDSPGHVDFSSEVSAAVRLSDAALVLVDVVEGVGAQTHVVLRQAWEEKIQTVLVLNKIDRLITEWRLSPEEAFRHMRRILEQVNAIVAGLYTSSMMMQAEKRRLLKEEKERLAAAGTADEPGSKERSAELDVEGQDEDWADDAHLYFEPERGNVIFASAIDGWGFTVDKFASILAAKLQCRAEPLRRCLWGDYYLTKEQGVVKIRKDAEAKGKPALFVKFVLENIWDAYKSIVVEPNKERASKIVAALGLKIPPRETQSGDAANFLYSVMSRWLPLAPAVLDVVCAAAPHPAQIPVERVHSLLYGARDAATLPAELKTLEEAMVTSNTSESAPVVAFVSKLVSVEAASLPENQPTVPSSSEDAQARRAALLEKRRAEAKGRSDESVSDAGQENGTPSPLTDGQGTQQQKTLPESSSAQSPAAAVSAPAPPSGNVFIAYTRVFSGTIKPGMKLHVLGPKYDPLVPDKHRTEVIVGRIYLFMGRSLLPLLEAPAGSIVGIAGLDEHVLKSVTLSSTPMCTPLTGLYHHVVPIVRVALETQNIADMPALKKGLQLLNMADACVEVLIQETGEFVLVGAGEVHIERCITDLEKQFAPGIKIRVSPPIVPFRETVVVPPKLDLTNEEINEENKAGQRYCYLLPAGIVPEADGTIQLSTATKRWSLGFRVRPLPATIVKLLTGHSRELRLLSQRASDARDALIKRIRISQAEHDGVSDPADLNGDAESRAADASAGSGAVSAATVATVAGTAAATPAATAAAIAASAGTAGAFGDGQPAVVPATSKEALDNFVHLLKQTFAEAGDEWQDAVDRIWACGPRNQGANLLLNRTAVLKTPGLCSSSIGGEARSEEVSAEEREAILHAGSVALGFQLVTQTGPLCDEPMMGTCFELTRLEIDVQAPAPDAGFPGQLISTTKECLRQAFLVQPVRLMTAMYACDLIINSAGLGKIYAVLNKRHGQVLSEEMQEGSDNFLVKALIPVTDSFGFAEELRRRTSGLAVPQLLFSHWEVIQEDPFWVPTTEEEILHYGEKGDRANMARKYMDDTRRRKGLYVEEKLVEHGEKQRTMSRKK